MCGIWAYFRSHNFSEEERQKLFPIFRQMVRKIRHRGPDWSGHLTLENVPYGNFIAHERLAINGLGSGAQPIHNKNLKIVLSVNGEIYNHAEFDETLRKRKQYKYQTDSDCECLMYLYDEAMVKASERGEPYEKYLKEFLNKVRGVFTFVLYDYSRGFVLVSRDPIGVNSLYYGMSNGSELYVSSEMKALEGCGMVKIFPPGQFLILDLTGFRLRPFVTYYQPDWLNAESETDDQKKIHQEDIIETATSLREGLIEAVKRRLMTEVPFGVLLSGGLDSSLIAAIAQRLVKSGVSKEWGNRIHTFSIGLKDSPDLIAAQKVADHIGSRHHSFEFTLKEAEAALEDVIYHLETYDITTIRASTPMYLLSRKIKAMGIKMVLSGEGSDEILGGYLYFHYAPSLSEFQKECVALLSRLHYADCLRANKSTMAWGLEVRVPFLDCDFLDLAVPVDPRMKMRTRIEDSRNTPNPKRIEKFILREAFKEDDYLPEKLLWRQKEQFSDGVGYGWIDHLKHIADKRVTQTELENHKMMTDETLTKEAYYYLKIYDKLFPNRRNILPRWKPKTDWEGVDTDDASGRSMKVHEKAY